MLNSYLYKDDQDPQQPRVVNSVGPTDISTIFNPEQPNYYRTTDFPQPGIVGIGYVNASGVADTTRFFFPSNWTITRNSAGNYTITHSIGNIQKYLCLVNVLGTTAGSVAVSPQNNSTNIYTSTDTGFMFVFYLIP